MSWGNDKQPLEGKIKALEGQVSNLNQQITRYQMSYAALASFHAQLMLDTLSREDIEHELDIVYPWAGPLDVIHDMKAALNAEQEIRGRMARRNQNKRKAS